jgi:hypothetical protein
VCIVEPGAPGGVKSPARAPPVHINPAAIVTAAIVTAAIHLQVFIVPCSWYKHLQTPVKKLAGALKGP